MDIILVPDAYMWQRYDNFVTNTLLLFEMFFELELKFGKRMDAQLNNMYHYLNFRDLILESFTICIQSNKDNTALEP